MLTRGISPDFRGGVRVHRVTQLGPDGVHCRESAGTGPVVLKVVSVTGATILQVTFPRHDNVDPMSLPSKNPIKCHEDVLYLQPMFPSKRFDVSLPYLVDVLKV